MKKTLMTAFALIGFLGALAAQNGDGQGQVLELTLDQAIEMALNDNPTIKVAGLEIERQDYVRKETLGNLLPSLSGTGNYTYSVVKQKMSRDGLSFGADNTITGAANLTVPLFAPAVYASLGLNRSQMESAVEAARSSKINMVSEVRKAYYGILLAQQSLQVLEESAGMMQRVVDNTEVMYQSGLSSEYDLLTAQVQLSNIQPTIIQTRNSIDISKMLLKMYLSIPQEYDIRVAGTLDEFRDRILGGVSSYTTDVTNNSDLRNLEIQEQMLRQQIRLINSQRLPTVVAFGSLTYTGNDMGDISFFSSGGSSIDPAQLPIVQDYPEMLPLFNALMGDPNKKPETGFWWQHPISVGIQVSIPIFSGNKNVNQARQARNTLAQLNLQRDYLEQSVRMQAINSVNSIMTAREKMNANENTVNQARKALAISETRYEAGTGTILELNSAQLSLVQAQLNYSNAIYDYLSAEADHEKTIGREYLESDTRSNR